MIDVQALINEIHDSNTEEIGDMIMGLFSRDTNVGYTFNEILTHIKKVMGHDVKANQIANTTQQLINSKIMRLDNKTNKIYNNHLEEDEEDEYTELADGIIGCEDDIREYLNSSVSGSISGISFDRVLRDIRKKTGKSKIDITNCIKKMFASGEIIEGSAEGTIMINSMDEDEENMIITSDENADTLKAKGWQEESPDTFISQDGKQKYTISTENSKLSINKNMNKKQLSKFDLFLEDVEDSYQNDEYGFEDTDSTDGLDEFDSDSEIDSELDTEEAGDVTLTLDASEIDLLRSILNKVDGGSDEGFDDLASDEDATDSLVDGDDELDVEVDEDGDDDLDFDMEEDEEDDELDFEEDEEDIADSGNGSVYDGSGRQGAPSLSKTTPSYDNHKGGKPVNARYRNTNSGTAYDGSGRQGAPSLSKTTPSYDGHKGGKPVKSKQTSAARGKNSLLEL